MKLQLGGSKERNELKARVEYLTQQMQEATLFIQEIEKGNLATSISEQTSLSEIGLSLLNMQKHLSKLSQEEHERTWTNVGLAKFSDILRNKQSLDLNSLSSDILSQLIKYMEANQGAIYVLENATKGNEYLEMVACYAYDRKKHLSKRIELGEGLTGQCVLEKDTIYLTDVPRNYISITSGLGEATPTSILMTPLLINEKVFGVLELASFGKFAPYKIEFINRLAENIASTIKNVKDAERTHFLLSSSQQQTEELRAQEEEMRQNLEEMQATQEEMARKNEEIAKAAAESSGVLKGINTLMATVEFAPDGTVLDANPNFLRAMGYSLSEVVGVHHKKFVPKEETITSTYKEFWNELAAGKPSSGIFRRINSKGETVWLNAIYNPIFNPHGQVVKVIKFATDITLQQEKLAENKGVLGGIDSTMATIEFSPTGHILSANPNFLKAMKYTLPEILGQHHSRFVPKEMVPTAEYKNFWMNLSLGNATTGIFKRIDSKGQVVWLNAIYNPILNANGDVVKVIKFASDITSEQEIQAENKSIWEGINATLSTVEFTPDGEVLHANEHFLSEMGFTLAEIKGQHHRQFLPEETVNSFDYTTFWLKLSSGIAISGTFPSIDSQGDRVLVNAIYNPILNSSGKVHKVMKMITSATREKIHEMSSL